MDSDSVKRRAERATARFGTRSQGTPPGTVARYRAAAYESARVDAIARKVVDDQEVAQMSRFWYLAFARAGAKLFGRYSAQTFANELESLVIIWERRGLDREVLLRVADAVTTALAREEARRAEREAPER